MSTMFDGAVVTGLWRYPISTLGGEHCDSLQLAQGGPVGDRTHGLFDAETGENAYPVRDPRWNRAPEISARISNGTPQASCDGKVWLDVESAPAREMLSSHFGRGVEARRYGALSADGIVAEARYSMAPVHLISRQALAQLSRVLPQSDIDPRRFRPNIVVDLPSAPEGIPEYNLLGQKFRIGNVILRGVSHCGRCGFTTLAQGELPADPDVLRTLVDRFQRNLGIYCVVETEGTLQVGQRLEIPRPRPIVIVGAGQAGAMAARTLRELGYRGPVHLIGNEARPPYERPELSKALFRGVPDTDAMTLDEAKSLDIDLRLDSGVVAVDPDTSQLTLADGNSLDFARLVIATGGRARNPMATTGPRVRTLRTRDDAQAIALAAPRRLLILGGGWIAMEAAAAARAAGIDVTVLVRGPALAHRLLPRGVSDHLAALHRSHGIDLRLGVTAEFSVDENAVHARIDDCEMSADMLLIATGIAPNDDLGRQAGIASDAGIIADAAGKTGNPLIHAVGDVALQPGPSAPARIESWQNANDQARACVQAMLGLPLSPRAPLRFWSDQFGKRIQIAGLPHAEATLCSVTGDAERPFWDYGDFAIGVDRPQEIHCFDSEPRPETARPQPPVPVGPGRKLVARSAVPEGALLRIKDPEYGVLAVTRTNGRVYAVADACPHALASLSDGFVADGHIVCPVHFAEFDLADGTPRKAPAGCRKLTVHAVSETDDLVLIHDGQT
ncbi:hypothetical protein A8B82_02135 [Sulfitobacter sp. EhC04]|uniref:FAD-dependent oxidoreductase n=1 Tax=Sulfitobacter sp. EhC04 TaxID=1849168 RepID=UPI0007F52BA9|nr:FAD-dependent oxidoreductase [Sulfitobacter sp. EhC04]OAN75750.1 hypothetical protein A8B82_02135 [Sulfitobacter sp. EhC04]